jgi:hypothetical protein
MALKDNIAVTNSIVYVTINKAMEGSPVNYISTLIDQEQQIIAFYQAKKAELEVEQQPNNVESEAL